MILYIARRILSTLPTLLILMTLTFFLLRVAPGGPFDTDRSWPPEVKENILRRYGLDQPLTTQFTTWVKDLAHGDLRESFQYLDQPVAELIRDSLPYSAWVGFWAILLSISLGIPLGVLSAWKKNTWVDYTASFLAISGVSLPTYLAASLLILIFAMGLGWFPPALIEGPSSYVLPVVTLGLRPVSMIARLTRSAVLEALSSDYVRTAYAKGLPTSRVLFQHALKNSLVPILALLGPLIASLITGSFLVETIFQIPGMGKHFVGAVLNRDYPLVMGVTLFYGMILLGCNLLVDLAYGWVDPRIRLS